MFRMLKMLAMLAGVSVGVSSPGTACAQDVRGVIRGVVVDQLGVQMAATVTLMKNSRSLATVYF